MSEYQKLRALVSQRLTAATEDICEMFYVKISEYEEELRRQRELLDAVLKPEVRTHRADVQQVLVTKQEKEWSPILDQVDPPKLLHIKEEQRELRISQEREKLQSREEGDIAKVTFSPASVKTDKEEKPESSQLQQSPTEENRDAQHLKTEDDEEDCAGRATVRDSDSDSHLEEDTEDSSDFSEPETDDSDDWTKSSELLKPFSCSECGKQFTQNGNLKTHMRIHTMEKPFSCSVCSMRFVQKVELTHHMARHSKVKKNSCTVCKQIFTWRYDLNTHKHAGCPSSQLHQSKTEENRYVEPLETDGEEGDRGGSEPVHDKMSHAFEQETDDREQTRKPQSGLNPLQNNDVPSSNMKYNSGKTSVSSSECSTSSAQIQTGVKPFRCSVCGRRYQQKNTLKVHMRLHFQGKCFVCPVCYKTFQCRAHLGMHKKSHTE